MSIKQFLTRSLVATRFLLAGTSIVALAVVIAIPTAANAQPAKQKATKFFSVLDLRQTGIGTVLIGGQAARSADFPASFYTRSDGFSCTAALVASRALLLAAHCMSDGAPIVLSLRGKEYEGVCTHAPGYAGDKTADWALCLMALPVAGVPYERVNVDGSRVRAGTRLLLTGFGCTTKAGDGGHDNVYRIGEATVETVPSRDSNDIVTKGSVVLCYGDSGGPAFVYLDDGKRDRVVVSVNSRVGVDKGGMIVDTSYLSSISTDPARQFLSDWSTRNGIAICGVHPNAANCRTPP